MKKLTVVLLLLACTSNVFAAPIDFSTLSTVATSYGQVAAATNSLTAYQGNIYYTTFENSTNASKVYQYNPTTGTNTQFLAEDTGRFTALRTMGNNFYMSDTQGNVYVSNGSSTSAMTGTPFSASDHVQSMAELNDTKYFGTSSGKMFRYDGINFTKVYETSESRAILSLDSWQKNGRIYASIQSSSGYTNDGWTISSNTGNIDSWETILTGVHHTDLFLPTEDYLYAAVMDNVSWYNSTIRKSSDGISFSVISQSSGNIGDYTGYKMAFGAFSYNDIAYFFENSYTGTGSIIMDNGGIVSQVPNTNLAFMQATELNGTVYALAADEPFESGNVYLITTATGSGATFSFNQSQVMNFDKIGNWSNDTDAVVQLKTMNNVEYGAWHDLPANSVGLVASDVGESSFAYLGIGLTGVDLSGFDLFQMVLSNDDDDDWEYKLFADDGVYNNISVNWEMIVSGANKTLELDISSIGSNSAIGFQIGASREQWMHTSTPIPEPPEVEMEWVTISDPGFTGHMSKYETTNAQYCRFLNDALASGDITVDATIVYGANGSNSGADFVDEVYYDLAGSGNTYNGATNGGAARINWTGSSFTVDSGFEDHPVTYVSWYGSTAFASYYGWRLPTEWEWQAVADYNGTYTYGCGTSINNNIANYYGSTHPDGTTIVGAFGTYGYGMCDMAGNVWEWTSSIRSGDDLVYRAGCWGTINSYYCTVSWGDYGNPVYNDCGLGFRVVRNAEPAGPVAYWSFDNPDDPGHDDSGNGNDGTVLGATSAEGICGKALSFDGINDYVDVPDAPDLNPTDAITITAWFKADSFALGMYSWPHIVFKASDGHGYFTLIWHVYENNPSAGFGLFLEGQGQCGVMGTPRLEENTWYFAASVYDGNTIKVYVGTSELSPLVVTSANYSGNIVPSSDNLNIGRDGYNATADRYFDGVIDEVRIYDRALSSCEIEQLYGTCPQPTNTSPIADAGEDQTCNTGPGGVADVILDCSGSGDPDGDELTYTWYLDGEVIATGCDPVIELPCGTYILELIVNDGTVDSEPNYVEITVLDSTPPGIICPGNITLEYPADTDPNNTGQATATDNCDDSPLITYSDESLPGCGKTEVITRTWTAMDESGNSSTCDQIIEVINQTPAADAGGPYVAQATSWNGASIQLNGTGSTDPDGDELTYEWNLDLAVGSGDPNDDSVNDVDATEPNLVWPFPIGQTQISLVVIDECGARSEPDITTVTVSVINVGVEIRSDDGADTINLESHGVVRITFLTDEDFDAKTVDPMTVVLRGMSFEDGLVQMRGKNDSMPMVVDQDYDGDGDIDRVVNLDTERLAEDELVAYCEIGALTYDGLVVLGFDIAHLAPVAENPE